MLWALVAIFAVVAAAGAFVWLRFGAPALPQKQALQAAPPLAQPIPDEPLTITLYYPENGALSAGTAAVKRQPDPQAQARETLAAVFTDPRATRSSIFKDLKPRAFFLDASGTAYVDLSFLQQSGAKASAGEELLAVYTMVNTLTQNFEEIKQVRFLLEGKEAQTLAGHIDLSRKFEKRIDLVKQ